MRRRLLNFLTALSLLLFVAVVAAVGAELPFRRLVVRMVRRTPGGGRRERLNGRIPREGHL
jgi:hypothetical protein